jgi:hypothetical protein
MSSAPSPQKPSEPKVAYAEPGTVRIFVRVTPSNATGNPASVATVTIAQSESLPPKR